MKIGRVETPFGGSNLIIEYGQLAKQANGAVKLTYGGTVVLCTACMAKKPKEGIDFFPLMVEYQEKTYAAGKIPGGFFKREGKPTEKEVLTSRVIDRPIRPLFPEGFRNEVQVVAFVLSHDGENDADVLAIIGASAALAISDIPFDGVIGGIRIGLVDGQFVVNPTYKQREMSALELVVAGHEDGIVMIEGEANEVPEEKIVEALKFAQENLKPVLDLQKKLKQEIGKTKLQVEVKGASHENVISKVRTQAQSKLGHIYSNIANKQEREDAIGSLFDELTGDLSAYDEFKTDDFEVTKELLAGIYDQVQYEQVRKNVLEKGLRADGRGPKEIRALASEVGVLPRTHGSSLFTRGQTQSLAIVTLGTRSDEQMIEGLEETTYRTFMLHYNFPSFSVGETKPMRGPGRREIGHGALAGKSLKAVLPSKEEFPYTIRVVSEILESNGSSSMASVCAGTLALMDAGVPIKAPVAGISIGFIADEKKTVLLSDIMGMEDHFGDMDFKVSGTRTGVTAIQLDLKVKGVTVAFLKDAIDQAKEGRLHILDHMQSTINAPREDMSPFAPRIATVTINQDKIGEVIGPGGKMIRKIIEETGVTSIDIEEDGKFGKVLIASPDKAALDKAVGFIKGMTEEPEIGRIYDGTAKRIMNFGVFVEFLPGREGLVHVSELAKTYVKDVNEVVKVGDKFKVKLIEIDQQNRVNLSKKQAE